LLAGERLPLAAYDSYWRGSAKPWLDQDYGV